MQVQGKAMQDSTPIIEAFESTALAPSIHPPGITLCFLSTLLEEFVRLHPRHTTPRTQARTHTRICLRADIHVHARVNNYASAHGHAYTRTRC